MLWDLMQQRQIGKARRAASEAASSANRTESDLAELNQKVDSLTLACQAMWELLRKQGNVTDELFLQQMQDIDLRDGRADGKMRIEASTCPACSRPNNPRHEHCLYCGGPLPPPKHVFARE